MRYLLCLICLACATPCFGQDLLNRVAQLEALTAQQAKRLDTIEDRLAKIEAGLSRPSGMIVNTDLKPHLPTPPCPNCQCGCTVTGQCTCKDCDHPALVPPAKKILRIPDGSGGDYSGGISATLGVPVGSIGRGSDGQTYIKTLLGWQPLSSAPASLPVGGYSSLPAFGGGGGCANGSCSGGRRR